MRVQARPLQIPRRGGDTDGQPSTRTTLWEAHNCSVLSLYLSLELSLYPG